MREASCVLRQISDFIDTAPAAQRQALAGGYCYKRLAVGAERYKDVPDSLCYAFVSSGENPRRMKTGPVFDRPIQLKSTWSVFNR
jgi:hypothetical protein